MGNTERPIRMINDLNDRQGKGMMLRRAKDLLEGRGQDLRLDLGLPITNENLRLYRGCLCLVVGETGSGKSSFATHIAMSAAVRAKQRVVYISTEDGSALFEARSMNWWWGIPPIEVMEGRVADVERLATPAEEVPDYHLKFYGDKRQLDDVLGTIEHEAYEGKADLIIVDYVQAIRPPMPSDGVVRVEPDRRALIAGATAGIRRLVEMYKCTVILMSQVRRMKENEQLTLSHAKEAGELENAADIGVLLEASKDSRNRHDYSTLTVVKHKLPVASRPWRFQRDASRGGAFTEVDGGGQRTEADPLPWERDDEQTNPGSRSEIQRQRHEQGGGGESEYSDVEQAPPNGAGPYPAGWANRHDVR